MEKIRLLHKLFFYSLFFICHVSSALESCTVGDSGKERNQSGRLEFCNGTSWMPMGVTTSTTCTDQGKTKMVGTDLLFCSGTLEMSQSCGDTGISCTGSQGKKRYFSNQMQFCNGTNWINMSGGPCPVPGLYYCQAFADAASCAAAPKGCEWGTFECYPRCTIRNTPALCADLSPDCDWSTLTSQCNPVY